MKAVFSAVNRQLAWWAATSTRHWSCDQALEFQMQDHVEVLHLGSPLGLEVHGEALLRGLLPSLIVAREQEQRTEQPLQEIRLIPSRSFSSACSDLCIKFSRRDRWPDAAGAVDRCGNNPQFCHFMCTNCSQQRRFPTGLANCVPASPPNRVV